MRKINRLDEKLIAKIAAGEVVENPASVVKELLENSIDAGSDSITVEIEMAGKKLIRITDNGCGIPRNELPLAFERHATSKLKNERDLFEIRSLGFRGEALASIAAVSELEIITKTSECPVGAKALVENGDLIEAGNVGAPEGTTVFCRNLFAKVPARLKFLKSDTAETNKILDVASRLAIAQNHISFKIIVGGRHLYTTPGNNSLADTLYAIHGKKLAGNLSHMDFFHKDMHLYGMVSNLKNHHSNRNMQVFYVNKRWVKSPLMSDLLNGAFIHLFDKRRYPVAFLFLDMHPSSVDINISPSKTEIKFKDESALAELFRNSFAELIESRSWIPDENLPERIFSEPAFPSTREIHNFNERTEIREAEPQPYIQKNMIPQSSEPAVESFLDKIIDGKNDISKTDSYTESLPKRNPRYFQELKIIGQIFNSYIICEDCETNEMVLIDQHAAHEKMLYEKFAESLQKNTMTSQVLLEPIPLDIPDTEKSALLESKAHLKTMGFSIEDFGPNILIVREIPSMFPIVTSIAFLEEIKDMLDVSAKVDCIDSEEVVYSLAVKACHSAIRANDKLETIEMETLLADMDTLKNPYTCPHGRPTVYKIGRTEIEKHFNR